MNPTTREEGWPVLYVREDRFRGAVAGYHVQERATKGGGEQQTYHPESAPNVLTKDEARLVTTIAAEYYGTHGMTGELVATDDIRSFFDRLKSWAEEEGH